MYRHRRIWGIGIQSKWVESFEFPFPQPAIYWRFHDYRVLLDWILHRVLFVIIEGFAESPWA